MHRLGTRLSYVVFRLPLSQWEVSAFMATISHPGVTMRCERSKFKPFSQSLTCSLSFQMFACCGVCLVRRWFILTKSFREKDSKKLNDVSFTRAGLSYLELISFERLDLMLHWGMFWSKGGICVAANKYILGCYPADQYCMRFFPPCSHWEENWLSQNVFFYYTICVGSWIEPKTFSNTQHERSCAL